LGFGFLSAAVLLVGLVKSSRGIKKIVTRWISKQ
jgi:hypothetical protein